MRALADTLLNSSKCDTRCSKCDTLVSDRCFRRSHHIFIGKRYQTGATDVVVVGYRSSYVPVGQRRAALDVVRSVIERGRW